MKKQLFIALLVPWLLFYLTGCYSMYDISKEDMKKNNAVDNNLQVVTNDGELYLFKALSYVVRNDTLTGAAIKTAENTKLLPKTKIALTDVSAFKMEKLNGGTTFLAILGTLVIVGLIYVILLANAFNNAISNIGVH